MNTESDPNIMETEKMPKEASEDAPSSVDKEEETTEAKEDESETRVSSAKEESGVAEDKVMTEGEPTEEGKEAPTEGEQKEAATKEEGKPEEEKKETEGDESSNLFRIDSGLLPFPEKLMALLDGNKVSDAMWWLPDGDAFCLIPVVFAEKVLDRHFQGTKFESFTRKLNRWGFKRVAGQKVPANTIAYYNKHFIRGKPKLLKNMNGGKNKFISAREKRVRAQLKRERDREQAVMIAAQHQHALQADRFRFTNPALMRSMGGGFGGGGLYPGGGLGLGGGGATGDAEMRERVLMAELAARKQREELQLQLLRGGGMGYGGMMPGMDPSSSSLADQQALLGRGGAFGANQLPGGALGGPGQLMSGGGDPMPGGGGAAEGGNNPEQQLMQQQQRDQELKRNGGGGKEPAEHPGPASGNDNQLLQMYLQQQQQRRELELSLLKQQYK